MADSVKMRRASHNKARGRYASQKFRTEKNRKRRWEKHIKKYPNDAQAKSIIKSLDPLDKQKKSG